MSDDIDIRLKRLLAASERAADEAFTARVSHAVLAETRLRAAGRAAWTRFAVEMVAAACAILAFVLLARLTPASGDGIVPLFSPAAAGLLLLVLWVAVSPRAASAPI